MTQDTDTQQPHQTPAEVHRYGFEIARDRELAEQARQQELKKTEAEINSRSARQHAEGQEQAFQQQLRHVARLVQSMPFGALLSVMIKLVIAFWLANAIIVLLLYLLLASLGASLIGLP